MRKHILALEGLPVKTGAQVPTISMEEADVMTDEAAGEASSIETDLGEANRMLDVSDGMEDMAVVADGIEEATPGEVALIDNATQMAVAGTDATPEELVAPEDLVVVPEGEDPPAEGSVAVESLVGNRISVEGIRETAKRIWDNIVAFLKKIWDRIVAYFRVAGVVPVFKKRLEALRKAAKEAGAAKGGEHAKFKVATSLLAVDGKMVKNGAELNKALEETIKAAAFVYGQNAEHVATFGKELATKIGTFKPENAAEIAKEVREVCAKNDHLKVPGAKASKTEGSFEVFEGEALLGGGHIVTKIFKDAADASDLGALDHFRRSGVFYENPKSGTAVTEVEFEALSVAEIEALIKKAEDLLNEMAGFHSKQLPKLKQAGEALKSASAKATAEVSKLDSKSDAGVGQTVAQYRSVLNFNAAYMGWVQSPAIPFYGKSISTVKGLMMVISRSLGAYESKGKSADAKATPAAA
jgi:hypothetical protein